MKIHLNLKEDLIIFEDSLGEQLEQLKNQSIKNMLNVVDLINDTIIQRKLRTMVLDEVNQLYRDFIVLLGNKHANH